MAAFCPADGLVTDLLVTVVVDFLVVTELFSDEGFVTGVVLLVVTVLFPVEELVLGLLVIVLVDFLVVTALFPFEGFVTGLLVIVVVVVLLFIFELSLAGRFGLFIVLVDLLVVVFTEETAVDFLY